MTVLVNILTNSWRGGCQFHRAKLVALVGAVIASSGSAHAESRAETAARATIEKFIATCGPVVTDPTVAVAEAALIPDVSQGDSPDGAFDAITFPMSGVSETDTEVYVAYEVASVASDTWIVTCNTISEFGGEPVADAAAAFEAVVDSMPGLQRVGGVVPLGSVGGVSAWDLEEAGIAPAVYVVTGWWDEDPLLHMWAEMGDFGYDLWIQHSVRKSQ